MARAAAPAAQEPVNTDPQPGPRATPRPGQPRMVATSQPLAAQAGVEMLAAGGTAADAAVAAAAA